MARPIRVSLTFAVTFVQRFLLSSTPEMSFSEGFRKPTLTCWDVLVLVYIMSDFFLERQYELFKLQMYIFVIRLNHRSLRMFFKHTLL